MITTNCKKISIKFHWNATIWILPLLITIPFIILWFLAERHGIDSLQKYLYIIFLAFIVVIAGTIPIRLEACKKGVKLRKLYGSLVIPANAIIECKKINNSYFNGSIKAFSMGKIKKNNNRWYVMYATEFRNLVLVRTEKKDYIFSCRQQDDFVDFVNGLK